MHQNILRFQITVDDSSLRKNLEALENFDDYYFELATIIILENRINRLVLPYLVNSFAVVELPFRFKEQF